MYVQVCENLFTPTRSHRTLQGGREHNQTKYIYTLKKQHFHGIRVLGFLCTGLSTCAHIFVLHTHTHSLFIIFVRDEKKKNEKTRRNLVPWFTRMRYICVCRCDLANYIFFINITKILLLVFISFIYMVCISCVCENKNYAQCSRMRLPHTHSSPCVHHHHFSLSIRSRFHTCH